MAMEFVDRNIVGTLQRLDETFFDDMSTPPVTINELSMEQIYSAIVLLLWSCDASTRSSVTSRKLPQGMAARYRAATDVVNAIKTLGVRDEIAYQSLLYGQAKEMRNVVLGLIEKLPKQCPLMPTAKDPRTTLIAIAACSLRAPNKFSLLDKYSSHRNSAWKPSWGVPARVPFQGFSGDVQTALKQCSYTSRGSAVMCACLEANASGTVTRRSHTETMSILQQAVQCSGQRTSTRNQQPKPPLPAKPSSKPSLPPKPGDLIEKISRKEAEAKETAESRCRLNTILEESLALRAALEQRVQQLAEVKEVTNKETRRVDDLRSQEAQSGLDPRIKLLIEDQQTVDKLTKYIDESEDRMEHVQNKWIGVKKQKDDELRKARVQYDAMGAQDETESETSEMLRMADNIEFELDVKQKHLLKLKREVEKMERVELNRSAYTKRIFEIVANLRKQQEDLDKVLTENRQIQKEIKSLTGKLDRTFTVVEEKLYRDTQRDLSMQKAYRLLVKIHEECSWIISATETCGRLNREVDELQDQIALEQQKRLDETLEKVLNDFLEVKNENESLIKTMRA